MKALALIGMETDPLEAAGGFNAGSFFFFRIALSTGSVLN